VREREREREREDEIVERDMRMGKRVKVGIAAATLASGRTGYTDIQLVRFRMLPKYPSAERFAGVVAYYYYHHHKHHHYHHPFLHQTPTSRISACVARLFSYTRVSDIT